MGEETVIYNQLVSMHVNNVLAGHFGPAFFAWHRQYLRKFEQALQDIKRDPSLGLPYWDWTIYNSKTSTIWGSDLMGGNGNANSDWQVMDGPFAYNTNKWPLNVRTG
jgi:tyrosinase